MRILRFLFVATCSISLACAQTASSPLQAQTSGLAETQPGAPASPKLKGGFDINSMDKSIDPCVDFYHYACGTWLKENPVPPDKAVYGRFAELADRNRLILRSILEEASAPNANRSATDQKIGDYYASCMDESGIEKKGTAPLAPELARSPRSRGKATCLLSSPTSPSWA
jgi:putative endopeptidase